METLSTIDTDLFLYLNSLHVEWMDKIMILITNMGIWFPLYLLLIYWTAKQFGKRCWWVFLAVGVVVLCSDQLSSHVFKPVFQRLRPCYNPDLQDLMLGIVLYLWAFISSYSRIYLGFHYPGDILCGSILGILVGLVLWKVFQQIIIGKVWKSE